MTTTKQTKSSTALARILALPFMVGALAACDYASKLPDAPSNLGGYDVSEKPPSVTGGGEAKRLPPPQDAFAKLKAPVEDRTSTAVKQPLDVAMAEKPKIATPALKTPAAPSVAPIDVPPLPSPVASADGQDVPLSQIAFQPLEFETGGGTASVSSTPTTIAAAPVAMEAPAYTPESYTPPAYTPESYQTVDAAPDYQSYDAAPIETYAVEGSTPQPEYAAYEPAPIAPISTESYASAPVEAYAIAAPPPMQVETFEPTPAPMNRSPIAVLRSRLPNGAVVNVHPIIGAPGMASATLARTVTTSIGAPVNEAAARSAPVAFDLRGHAERNTDGYVSVEWKLLDADRNVVGIFPERQDGASWNAMSDDSLRAMGQRVADRIARNSEMRRATLVAAANPVNTVYASAQPIGATTFVLKKGANLAQAPMPRVSPRATTYNAPTQVVTNPTPIVTQPYVQPAAPRPTVVTQAPTPLAAPAPIQVIPQSPQIITQAPRSVAPPPTFDTLRPVNNTQPVAAPTVVASGPRPLVFRGVQGAPGDGDQALGREVGKLLAQSGARMSSTPQPGALFLTAQVSKTPGANTDRIEIIWRVQDSKGDNIGQVTQANDVPRGMLDNAWGEDAIYAAEGARDGIMELLQGVGALDS